jgi:hypothetical protein
MTGYFIGNEMNLRHGFFCISALCLAAGLTASPAHAQVRVGEAAVIKNEVVRVMGSATSRINVGDGVVRDEIVSTGLDSAARLVRPTAPICRSVPVRPSSSTAPCSTTSTPTAISPSG